METKKETTKVALGKKDRVLVTYKSRWYDMVAVHGIILDANSSNGWPFRVRLEDAEGKMLNFGHDDAGGEPGSGPFLRCDHTHIKLVEKYVPKRLDGAVKEVWKEGERFIPKDGLSTDHNEEGAETTIIPEMVDVATSQEELTIAKIISIGDVTWFIDGTHNFFWKKEWIDPVE
jgi:hypothetical protein